MLFLYIHWFSHLRGTLESPQLKNVVFSPRIITGFPRLKSLVVQNSALHPLGDTNEGDNTPAKVDPHGAFKGSLRFFTQSKNLEIRLLEALPDWTLGCDAIRIGVTGDMRQSLGESINRLLFRSSTLEVLDLISKTNERVSPIKINHGLICLTLTDRFDIKHLSLPQAGKIDFILLSLVRGSTFLSPH